MTSPHPVILGASDDACAACMPHFLLTFGDASRQPVGAVIVEAPSMFQARMTAVVRRLAPGVPFGEGLKLSAETVAAIPPEEIGRMMSGVEAEGLILRQAMQAKGADQRRRAQGRHQRREAARPAGQAGRKRLSAAISPKAPPSCPHSKCPQSL
jgi:hypothetical protein